MVPERSDAPAPLDYVHQVGPSRRVASHTLLMQNSAPGYQRLLRARDAVTLEAQVLTCWGSGNRTCLGQHFVVLQPCPLRNCVQKVMIECGMSDVATSVDVAIPALKCQEQY